MKHKKIIISLCILLPLLWNGCSTDHTNSTDHAKIEYGSNNGKYITILDTKIYYEEYGKGTPLILLEGGMGSIKDFEKCIPGLAKNYWVIAPDTPGQGRSHLADSINYEIIEKYMSLFIDSLKIDSAYVMGWSDGGVVSLLLAKSRHDKVKKVIAVGANNGVRGYVPPEFDLSVAHPDEDDVWEEQNKDWIANYEQQLARDWKRLYHDLTKMWYQEEYFPKSVLEEINIPVMIVQGDHDEIRLEHVVELHRLIKGSQLCILPNSSHAVFTDKPDLINTIAFDFFSK